MEMEGSESEGSFSDSYYDERREENDKQTPKYVTKVVKKKTGEIESKVVRLTPTTTPQIKKQEHPFYIMSIWANSDPNTVEKTLIEMKPGINKFGFESSFILSIHHRPALFSWKSKPYMVHRDFEHTNDIKKKDTLLKLTLLESCNHMKVLMDHLNKGFDNRTKSMFSTKYDVCTDIYNYLCSHSYECCSDIIKVELIEGARETVIW